MKTLEDLQASIRIQVWGSDHLEPVLLPWAIAGGKLFGSDSPDKGDRRGKGFGQALRKSLLLH